MPPVYEQKKHDKSYLVEERSTLTLGADFRAALVASCFRGALPPVDFRAVCLVRAIEDE